MKGIITLLLGLLGLAVPATCDDWLYRRCFCANPDTVGYVMFATWTNPIRSYSWYELGRTARLDEPATLFSKRCAAGSSTTDCIDIPDVAKYPAILSQANPSYVHDFCNTFEDGVETCAIEDHIVVGEKSRWWATGGVSELMSCDFECNTLWAKNDTSTFDLCSHSTSAGARIGTRQKEKKGGKIRERKEYVDCYQLEKRNWQFRH